MKSVSVTFEVHMELSTDKQTLVSAYVDQKHCLSFMSKHDLEGAVKDLCDSLILQKRILEELQRRIDGSL